MTRPSLQATDGKERCCTLIVIYGMNHLRGMSVGMLPVYTSRMHVTRVECAIDAFTAIALRRQRRCSLLARFRQPLAV